MEHFLLKRRLLGPCWLRLVGVRNAAVSVSHCAVDLTLDDPKGVTVYGSVQPKRTPGGGASQVIPAHVAALWAPQERSVVGEPALPISPPELTVVSMAMKTIMTPGSHTHEILSVALVVHSAVPLDANPIDTRSNTKTLVLLRPASGSAGLPPDFRALIAKDSSMKAMHDEKALLNVLLAHIENIDPDVLCGHNIAGFELDVLLHRCVPLLPGVTMHTPHTPSTHLHALHSSPPTPPSSASLRTRSTHGHASAG